MFNKHFDKFVHIYTRFVVAVINPESWNIFELVQNSQHIRTYYYMSINICRAFLNVQGVSGV